MSWNIIKLREESLSSSNDVKILVGLGVFICKLWTYKQLFWWYDVMSYLMDLSSKEKYTLLIDILNALRITRFMKLTWLYNDRAYKFKICGKHLNPEFWFLLFKKDMCYFVQCLVSLVATCFFVLQIKQYSFWYWNVYISFCF